MFIFTGYLDESGTHGGSATTVMGGLLARSDQWRQFESRFAAAQAKHGFRVWHTRKFRQRSGDFKGWSPQQCEALYWDLQKISGYGLTEAVAVALDNVVYEREYRVTDPPRKARFDTKYGLCFRLSLIRMMQEVAKRRLRNRIPPLHIVVEGGHKNYGDAERIFFELKKYWERGGINMLRTITKAEKDDCGQLMMADFIAHSEYLLEGAIRRGAYVRPGSKPVPRGQTAITHIRAEAGGLNNLRDELIERATPKKGPNAPASEQFS